MVYLALLCPAAEAMPAEAELLDGLEPVYAPPLRGMPVPGTGRRPGLPSGGGGWPRWRDRRQTREAQALRFETEACDPREPGAPAVEPWEPAWGCTLLPFHARALATSRGSLGTMADLPWPCGPCPADPRLGYGPETFPAGPRPVSPVACIATRRQAPQGLADLPRAAAHLADVIASRGEDNLARLIREQAADDRQTRADARRHETRRLHVEAQGPATYGGLEGDLAVCIADGRSGTEGQPLRYGAEHWSFTHPSIRED